MTRTLPLLIASTGLLAACGQPKQLQDNYGEAYRSSMEIQADRGRPTVADAAYPLTGFEGIELRTRVTEESTDEESGEAETTQTVEVE